MEAAQCFEDALLCKERTEQDWFSAAGHLRGAKMRAHCYEKIGMLLQKAPEWSGECHKVFRDVTSQSQ